MKSVRKDSLFYKCLAISLGAHAIALWIFYTQPLFLQPILTTILGKSGTGEAFPLTEEDIALSEKNIALEKAFNQILTIHPRRPLDLDRGSSLDRYYQPFAEADDFGRVTSLLSSLPNKHQIKEQVEVVTQPFSLPSILVPNIENAEIRISPFISRLSDETHREIQYIKELQFFAASSPPSDFKLEQFSGLQIHYPPVTEGEGAMRPVQTSGLPTPPLSVDTSEMIALAPPEEFYAHRTLFSFEPLPSHFLSRQSAAARLKPSDGQGKTSLPSISAYNLPEFSLAMEWHDDFDIVVRSSETESGKTLFSITLAPKRDLKEREMRQNFYFLIDRSNSIEKHRYQSFKRAVARALGSLKEGDHFNIIIFDSKSARLSEKPLPFTKKNVRMAEEFLEKQDHGSYFAATDIYHSLPHIIPTDVAAGEINSAILISDGESSDSSSKQCKMVRSWLEQNNSKVTLYAAAAGLGNNLAVLDLLSSFSRGRLLYSDTHTGFPRKLAKMISDLHHPIAKNLTVTVMKSNPESNIKIYPVSTHLPHLFNNQTYTLYGIADKPSDFILLLQGQNKNDSFAIMKTITFSEARAGGKELSLQWAKVQAHLFYEEYLKEGHSAFLEKAQALFSHESPHHRR